MPSISRFFGVVITMNYNDHAPPHFHARYGRHKALIVIGGLTVLSGSLPPRVLGLVVEWAMRHIPELEANWRLAEEQKPLRQVEPLE